MVPRNFSGGAEHFGHLDALSLIEESHSWHLMSIAASPSLMRSIAPHSPKSTYDPMVDHCNAECARGRTPLSFSEHIERSGKRELAPQVARGPKILRQVRGCRVNC